MQPVPYLFFKDRCEEALRAYAGIFGSPEPDLFRVKDSPMAGDMPEKGQLVMHGSLKLGDGLLYASDDIMGGTPDMAGAAVMVGFTGADAARHVFDALAQGGTVQMEFQPTFWSEGFGTLTDRYGVKWMIGADPASSA